MGGKPAPYLWPARAYPFVSFTFGKKISSALPSNPDLWDQERKSQVALLSWWWWQWCVNVKGSGGFSSMAVGIAVDSAMVVAAVFGQEEVAVASLWH